MKAYKCDICGRLYSRYNVRGDKGTNVLIQAVRIVNMSGAKPIREYDLCKECCESFNNWFKLREGINECEEEDPAMD